ncbi:MAG: chemotaxis protein CheW [Planctomycetes bacterium]|nr:chemotaxis protein CheW [Planctomycetota bacterium]
MAEQQLLIFRAGRRLCALPAAQVAETLRPLPVEALPQTPDYILGVSMLRGEPTPMVDLGALLTGDRLASPQRVVSLKTGPRRVGLLVSDVVGVRSTAALGNARLPTLIEHCAPEVVQQLAKLDDALLTVLKLGSVIPDDVWKAVAKGAA